MPSTCSRLFLKLQTKIWNTGAYSTPFLTAVFENLESKRSQSYIYLTCEQKFFIECIRQSRIFFFLKKNTMAIVCCRSLLHRYAGKLKLHTLVTVRNIYSEGNAFSNPLFLSVKSVSLESRYKRGPSQILAFLIRQVCWLTLKNCSAS